MAIEVSQLSPQQSMLMAAYDTAKPLRPKSYLNMFTDKAAIASDTTILEVDIIKYKNIQAEIVKKGEGGKKIAAPQYFTRMKMTPGDIVANQVLTSKELELMQAGETSTFRIGGKTIQTGMQLMARKTEWLKESIEQTKNAMCAEAVTNGIVYNTDKNDFMDYGIPAAVAMTYDNTTVFLAKLLEHFSEFRKINGATQTRSLLGIDLAKKILGDTLFQDTMYKMGYTNIAQNITVDQMGFLIGVFLGKTLEQSDFAPDKNGVDIVKGNQIKLIDTTKLVAGYAALEVKVNAEAAPDLWKGDIWVDVDTGSKQIAKSTLFAKSGFFPVILDANAIYTIDVDVK